MTKTENRSLSGIGKTWLNLWAAAGLICCTMPLAGQFDGMAVLGSEQALGSGSHEDLQFDVDFFWDVFKGQYAVEPRASEQLNAFLGEKVDLSPPVVLWPSIREFQNPFDWVFSHFVQGMLKLYLNTEEYSWGYILGRKLGYDPKKILIGARPGASIEDLGLQVNALLDYTKGHLPEKIFLLFSGSELCAPTMQQTMASRDYALNLEQGLRYLMTNGKPHPKGSTVYVLSYLSRTELLTEESILNKQVFAHGTKTSCEKLREQSYLPAHLKATYRHNESLYTSNYLPPNPGNLCPTLFAQRLLAYGEMGLFSFIGQQGARSVADERLKKEQREQSFQKIVDEMISILSSRIRSYRRESAQVVGGLGRVKTKDPLLKFAFLESTGRVHLSGDDIAQDCVQIALSGQIKIASGIYSELTSNPDPKESVKNP